MKMKDMSKNNRPREKLKKNGVKALSNEELLAILLNSGTKNVSCIELATRVINYVENLRDLMDLDYLELIKINGIKDSKACKIVASFELCKRIYSHIDENIINFNVSEDVYKYMDPLLKLEKKEIVYALYLDARCRLISKSIIAEGNISSVSFDTRKIIQDGIKNNCVSIILVHNHPSGSSLPSDMDIDTTIKFIKSCDLFKIRLLDHIIIGIEDYTSLANLKIIKGL